MYKSNHKHGYWTKERCSEEVLKYETRSAFFSGSAGAYHAAHVHGWLDEVCSHMKDLKTHYSKEECAIEATNYETKTEFAKKSPIYYSHAIRKGYMNEICTHMKKLGNPVERAIYAYEFQDHHVYIGLTSDIERRRKEHLHAKNSAVYKYIKNSNCLYEFKVLTGYLPFDEAALVEDEKIFEYADRGWILLNKKRGGDLGSKIRKYTKTFCKQIALQYSNKTEFRKSNPYFYGYMCSRGWIDELCEHMTQRKKKNGYWTKERCREMAKKYSRRTDFQKYDKAAYSKAFKSGWLDDICSHMSYMEFVPSKWTKETYTIKAQECETRGDFKKKYPNAYGAALDNGWLDELFVNHPNHGYKNRRVMIGMKSHQGSKYWTAERVLKEAHKYHSISEFAKKSSGAYDAVFELQILDKVHNIITPKCIRWTYDMIKEEAMKYNTKREFQKGSSKVDKDGKAVSAEHLHGKQILSESFCTH